MLGLFINTVPMRVRVERTSSVLDLLRAVRRQHVDLGAYENTPLVKIQEWSGMGPGTSLFESIVVFDNAELNTGLKALGGKWEHRDFRVIEQTNYAMTFFAYGESELLLRLVFDRSRFAEPSVERMAGHLAKLLASIADDPEQQVSELCLLTDDERSRILGEWNATSADYSRGVCIHQLFEAQAARTPDAIALVFEDRELTYADLNRRANQLGKKLTELGVGPDQLVGISLKRSPEMVVGMLAILKAGGAYVPLDPEYPSERLEFMIRDADITVLLTERAFDQVTVAEGVRVINVDDFGDHADNDESPNVEIAINPDNLAYVIYTSGSTGIPKGVMVEHRNVVNFFTAIDRVMGTDPGVWLAVTSISFDISIMELLWTLTRGFKVVIQGASAASTFAFDEPVARRSMDFSLFYFASEHGDDNQDKYRLLLEGARFADTHQFAAVWTPERHFHSFGGLYPNPSVTSAAIAAITQNVRVRAGSVVLPLHDPLRVAEEWAVVDNISKGRVDIAFASGWHARDFALAPESYGDRKEIMRRGIDTVRSLWQGESITRTSGDKSEVQLKLYPKPLQSSLPIWLTAAGSPDTFRAAGELGANLLTNLLGQSIDDLAEKIRVYREAWANSDHGSPESKVTLMLHTFVSDDADFVREKVREPFTQYLKTSVDLIKNAPWAYPAFQSQSRQKAKDLNETLASETVTESDLDALAQHAFERYFETSGLFGTPETCLDLVNRLKEIGVDEIACLVDFNVDVDSVLASLEHLDKLRELSNGSPNDYSIPAQIARHNVTHLQCTPSAARLMVSDTRTLASLGSLKHIALGGEASRTCCSSPRSSTAAVRSPGHGCGSRSSRSPFSVHPDGPRGDLASPVEGDAESPRHARPWSLRAIEPGRTDEQSGRGRLSRRGDRHRGRQHAGRAAEGAHDRARRPRGRGQRGRQDQAAPELPRRGRGRGGRRVVGRPDRADLPRAAAGHGGRRGGGRRGRLLHRLRHRRQVHEGARRPPRAGRRGAVRARSQQHAGQGAPAHLPVRRRGAPLVAVPRGRADAPGRAGEGGGRLVTVSEIPEIGRNWWLFLVVGLVSIIAGILAIVYPDITLLALGIIVGVGLLFSGGIEIAEAIAGDHESRVLAAIVGVLSIVAGLICLRRPGESLLAIVVVLGIYLVVAGIVRFIRSFATLEDRALQMGLGIIDVILGILILSLPELSLVTLAILFAISLLIRGAFMVWMAFRLRGARHSEPGATVPA